MRTQQQPLFETPILTRNTVYQLGVNNEWELNESEYEWEWEISPTDLDKAVEYNRKSMTSLGWQPYFDNIVRLFKLNYSPNEKMFAQAVAAWQQIKGLSPDGKVGPNTWKAMQASLGLKSAPKKTSSKPASSGSVSGNCIQQGSCTACENRLRAANPVQLVSVPTTLTFNQSGIRLNQQALEAYKRLYQAARADDISDPYLKIMSGYRSYARQSSLWKGRLLTKFKQQGCSEASLPCIGHAIDRTNKKLQSVSFPHPKDLWLKEFITELKQGGCSQQCNPRAAVNALRIGTAPPGSSPHHSGKAVDIFVGKAPGASSSTSTVSNYVAWQRKQPSFQWLVCNAARFGFYPYNKEPWHWEYNPK